MTRADRHIRLSRLVALAVARRVRRSRRGRAVGRSSRSRPRVDDRVAFAERCALLGFGLIVALYLALAIRVVSR